MIRTNASLREQIEPTATGEGVVLANAALARPGAGAVKAVDIGIARGRIAFVGPAGSAAGEERRIDLAGRMVWPRFADIHVHLDKGQVLGRTGQANGTLEDAIAVVSRDRAAFWNPDDLKLRIGFGLHCAWHHGSAMIRTHIDSHPGQWQISWDVFEDIRDEWAGRIALQGSSLVPITMMRDTDYAEELARRVARAGGSFGAVAFQTPDLPDLVETMFGLAARHGLDVDFHADETGDPASRTLASIARTALRYMNDVRVVAGHCCSLARQDEETRRCTLDAVARAGIGMVSLPACNLYLQDRQGPDASPLWRGLTAFKEARAAGVAVALASDNTRDPFHPFGDLDMLDTFRLGVRALHLDDPVDRWLDAATTGAARIAGHELPRIAPGDPADFIIFEGRSFSEVLARAEADRIVVAGGRALQTRLPPFSQLDRMGMPA